MASAITFKSTTLEGQLMEACERIAVLQVDETKNPNAISIVSTYSRNNLTGIVTVSLTIPTSDTIDVTDGSIDVLAESVFLD